MLKYILRANNIYEYPRKTAKINYSDACKTREHTEIRTSSEFCAEHRNDIDYGASARAKRELE
jgi:hypothetical protein